METEILKLKMLYLIDQLRNHTHRYTEDLIFDTYLYNASKYVLGDFSFGLNSRMEYDTFKSLGSVVEVYGGQRKNLHISEITFDWMCLVDHVIDVCLSKRLDKETISLLESRYRIFL